MHTKEHLNAHIHICVKHIRTHKRMHLHLAQCPSEMEEKSSEGQEPRERDICSWLAENVKRDPRSQRKSPFMRKQGQPAVKPRGWSKSVALMLAPARMHTRARLVCPYASGHAVISNDRRPRLWREQVPEQAEQQRAWVVAKPSHAGAGEGRARVRWTHRKRREKPCRRT